MEGCLDRRHFRGIRHDDRGWRHQSSLLLLFYLSFLGILSCPPSLPFLFLSLYNRRIQHVHPVLFHGTPYPLLQPHSPRRVFRPDTQLDSGNLHSSTLADGTLTTGPRSDFDHGNGPSASPSTCPGITHRARMTSSLQIRATNVATQCE
jgi:hypothetical protein